MEELQQLQRLVEGQMDESTQHFNMSCNKKDDEKLCSMQLKEGAQLLPAIMHPLQSQHNQQEVVNLQNERVQREKESNNKNREENELIPVRVESEVQQLGELSNRQVEEPLKHFSLTKREDEQPCETQLRESAQQLPMIFNQLHTQVDQQEEVTLEHFQVLANLQREEPLHNGVNSQKKLLLCQLEEPNTLEKETHLQATVLKEVYAIPNQQNNWSPQQLHAEISSVIDKTKQYPALSSIGTEYIKIMGTTPINNCVTSPGLQETSSSVHNRSMPKLPFSVAVNSKVTFREPIQHDDISDLGNIPALSSIPFVPSHHILSTNTSNSGVILQSDVNERTTHIQPLACKLSSCNPSVKETDLSLFERTKEKDIFENNEYLALTNDQSKYVMDYTCLTQKMYVQFDQASSMCPVINECNTVPVESEFILPESCNGGTSSELSSENEPDLYPISDLADLDQFIGKPVIKNNISAEIHDSELHEGNLPGISPLPILDAPLFKHYTTDADDVISDETHKALQKIIEFNAFLNGLENTTNIVRNEIILKAFMVSVINIKSLVNAVASNNNVQPMNDYELQAFSSVSKHRQGMQFAKCITECQEVWVGLQNNTVRQDIKAELDSVSSCGRNINATNDRSKKLHGQLMAKVYSGHQSPQPASFYIGKSAFFCKLCQIFGYYCTSLERHFLSVRHTSRKQHIGNSSVYHCKTCNVYLYGDNDLFEEHNKLQEHILLELLITTAIDNNGNASVHSDDCAVEKKDLTIRKSIAKTVDCEEVLLKSQHTSLIKDASLKCCQSGIKFYCNFCKYSSVSVVDWEAHIMTVEHRHECAIQELSLTGVAETMCTICDVTLIGNRNVLVQHCLTEKHKVFQKKKELCPVNETIAEGLTGNRQYDVKFGGSDCQSSTSCDVSYDAASVVSDTSEVLDKLPFSTKLMSQSNSPRKVLNKKNTVQKAKHKNSCESDRKTVLRKSTRCKTVIKGLPPDIYGKHLFNIVKQYGFISNFVLQKETSSAVVQFLNRCSAEKLIEDHQNSRIGALKGFHLSMEEILDEECIAVLSREAASMLSHNTIATINDLLDRMARESFSKGLGGKTKTEIVLDAMKIVIPNSKLYPFGSRVSGLAFHDSDLDVFLDVGDMYLGESKGELFTQERILNVLELLFKKTTEFSDVKSVLSSRVPVIRLRHVLTGLNCDITFLNGLAVENTKLIRMYFLLDSRVRWLVAAIKMWSRWNNLIDRSMFTSHTLAWLVLFYLMQLLPPVVPPVCYLRSASRGPRTFIADWDCRFWCDRKLIAPSENRSAPKTLLQGFFAFYAHLKPDKVVLCPLTGEAVNKSWFKARTLNLGSPFSSYVSKLKTVPNFRQLQMGTVLVLQDPFDLSHNISKAVNADTFIRFQQLCLESAEVCRP